MYTGVSNFKHVGLTAVIWSIFFVRSVRVGPLEPCGEPLRVWEGGRKGVRVYVCVCV